MLAARCLECEIEPGRRRILVRELGEGRRLKTLAEGPIEAQVLRVPVDQPRDGRGLRIRTRSAVVTMVGARKDEIVGGLELDPAGAQAGVRAPVPGEPPLGL